MIVVAKRCQGESTRRRIDLPGLFSYFKSEWLYTEPDEGAVSPLVYLVEQPPGSVLPAHFHRQNQFQVFVSGGGAFGRRPIEPGLVHYANAYTGYGPIIAGHEGLHYFTLRAVFDAGAFMVAESRDRMPRGPKRNVHGRTVMRQPGCTAGAGGASVRRESLFPLQPDCLAAEWIEIPSGARLALPAPEGLGVFCLVLEGSLRCQRETADRHETFYFSPEERPPMLEAGAAGARCLRLQIPSLAPEYLLTAQIQ